MYKKIIIIIAVALGVLSIGAIVYSTQDRLPKNAILTKDPQLTDSEKQAIETKINEYQAITNDSSKDVGERYKAYVQTGLQYFILGQYKDARDQYLQATKILPDNATAWAELYVAENTMMAYEQANEHIKQALTINSANPQFWRWYTELAGPLNISTDKIEQTYMEALKQTDNHNDIIVMYAKFLEERKGDLVEAVKAWKLAIEKNPGSKAQYETEIIRIQSKLQ